MFGIVFTRRIKAGLALIYLAGLGYLGEAALPFLNISHKAVIFTVILVCSELLFVAGVAVLGKPTYKLLKAKLIEYVRNRPKGPL